MNNYSVIFTNFLITVLFLLLILLSVCGPVGTQKPEEIIKTMNSVLSENYKDLKYINKWIEKQNYQLPYTLNVNRSEIIGKVYYNDFNYNIKDEHFAKYLVDFIYSTDFTHITVYQDFISYECLTRNDFLQSYYLLYFRNNEAINDFKTYIIYDKAKVPEKISGWLYHLKGNWYIKSPVDEKIKTDSLRNESSFKEHFVKSFKYKFNGVIKEKKPIEGNLKLLKLKLKSSDINYFEPRDSLKYFFCIIDYPFAEVVYNEEFIEVNVGDSISFNSDNLNYYNVLKIGEDPIYNIKPAVIEYAKLKYKQIFSITKYKNYEKAIKLETNNYKQNKLDKIYRFYIGKYKTISEFEQLKKTYSGSYLIDSCLINNTYLKISKGKTNFLFNNLNFYNLNHISKYYDLINKEELKVGVFNKEGELLKILKRVHK